MKFLIRYSILAVFLSGCSAHDVVRPGTASKSEFAPVNEQSRTGIIKYLNQGHDTVINNRRESAYKIMHEACNGKYMIANEGIKSEGGAIIPLGDSAFYSQSQYIYADSTLKCNS